jgi:hypothetical protein
MVRAPDEVAVKPPHRHLGEPTSVPRIAPARGPPLWELPVAGQAEREADPQAQPAPGYEFDQRFA